MKCRKRIRRCRNRGVPLPLGSARENPLVRDVYEPKTPDEKQTERRPTMSTGLPVEDQVRKEWKAALARIPRFFGDKRQITSVTELPMPAMPSPLRLRKRPFEATAATSAADERSISPAARRSPTHQRIRLTRSSTCWTDAAAPERRAGAALAPTLPSTLSLSLTGRRRSRALSTPSRDPFRTRLARLGTTATQGICSFRAHFGRRA
jgi:hypothetical protein